jgi:hypothetical protein
MAAENGGAARLRPTHQATPQHPYMVCGVEVLRPNVKVRGAGFNDGSKQS